VELAVVPERTNGHDLKLLSDVREHEGLPHLIATVTMAIQKLYDFICV
jgi:hypothetical protein